MQDLLCVLKVLYIKREITVVIDKFLSYDIVSLFFSYAKVK